MKFQIPYFSPIWYRLAVVVLAVAIAWATSNWWIPMARAWSSANGELSTKVAGQDDHEGHDHSHGGHNHDHEGHSEANSLELSEQARRSLGLEVGEVELQSFEKSISVPAMVVERPGRTIIQAVAPMTGTVDEIYAVRGESVRRGQPLFTIRLTHEDLVEAQTEFLQTLEELDVENREIARLRGISERGVIAGKTLLERQYAKDKLQALLRTRRQALLLHGLSEPQIAEIEQSRTLLRKVTVVAPPLLNGPDGQNGNSVQPIAEVSLVTDSPDPDLRPPVLSIQDLNVHQGEFVQTGQPLASLADYTQLYIEGRAFEQDSDALLQAAKQGATVTAVFVDRAGKPETVRDLEIVYLSNEVDPETRAFYFYVELPNVAIREVARDGHRFISWKHKPGQRLELLVPVEKWSGQIVLPVDAVTDEGAESYVFVQNGDHFDRRPVDVKYRGQHDVVLANDGSVFPGDLVALNGAHQMQMALKKKAGGGGADPHAGHMH